MMREGCLLKNVYDQTIFRPALSPLEASVLPAREKMTYGVLGMIRRAYEAGEKTPEPFFQRAKI